MTTAEDNPSDWFMLAAERLRAADAPCVANTQQ
jgi:hypothetical protein